MKPDREGIYSLLIQYKLHYIQSFSNSETNQYFRGEAQTPTCIFLLEKISTDNKVQLWDKCLNSWVEYTLDVERPIPVFLEQALLTTFSPN